MLLTESGQIYSWGSGANYRLGHGSDETVTTPKLISSIKGHVVDIAVGSKHCIAITDSGLVSITVPQRMSLHRSQYRYTAMNDAIPQ